VPFPSFFPSFRPSFKVSSRVQKNKRASGRKLSFCYKNPLSTKKVSIFLYKYFSP
jgi:hypothetical protein